jgi:hypothetical protein
MGGEGRARTPNPRKLQKNMDLFAKHTLAQGGGKVAIAILSSRYAALPTSSFARSLTVV